MNPSIFKFAVRMLVGWEAGKGNVILHGNSSLILKIVINGDIRSIHKYYPMPCYSGKHFMLKLLSVLENRRPALWITPPPPPIGGIRTPPPQLAPGRENQTAAISSHLLTLHIWPRLWGWESREPVSSSLRLPSTASDILRSSYHLLDNHHKVAEP